ncbi:ERF family protein [Bacillus sp. 03113]|uniref:ERF family protein n=1 Tax=Bacillus sp. 03113 TaxID=2578211 RepID=UPI00114380CB|nr:ERF family protein [Bacillus sp. 03113]
MQRSESIKNIAVALCKFQGECPAPKKTSTNPHFKSKYAPLEEIINVAKPHLAANQLSFFQSTTTENENIVITTLIIHSSGEFIESDPLKLPMGKNTAQGAGSSITYARRYSLCAALGIAAEEDDDANGASDSNNQQNNQFNKNAPMASEKQLNLIDKLLKDVASAKNITKDEAYKTLKLHMQKDMEWYTAADASEAIKVLTNAMKKGA